MEVIYVVVGWKYGIKSPYNVVACKTYEQALAKAALSQTESDSLLDVYVAQQDEWFGDGWGKEQWVTENTVKFSVMPLPLMQEHDSK